MNLNNVCGFQPPHYLKHDTLFQNQRVWNLKFLFIYVIIFMVAVIQQ